MRKGYSLSTWVDVTDGHEYSAGDSFPHDGRPIPDERIGEVQTYEFDRAVPAWYQKLRGRPKPVTIFMRLILPAEVADAGVTPEANAD